MDWKKGMLLPNSTNFVVVFWAFKMLNAENKKAMMSMLFFIQLFFQNIVLVLVHQFPQS